MNGEDAHKDEIPERTIRELARLADGSLQGRAREALEEKVAASPTLRAALERQRTGASALRGLEIQTPTGLRARVLAEGAAPSPLVRRRRLAFGGGLVAAALAAVLLALVFLPSGAGGPTVVEAAQFSKLPAMGSVNVASSNPKLLAAAVDDVPFPNWTKEFGWRQAGIRSDRLDGRDTRTVFYEHEGKRVAYTIVSGDGIGPPSGSRGSHVNGVSLHSTSDDGRRVVTWWRDGRTCVLSSSNVSDAELLKLASWKGDGAVPF
ncbi:MAG: hypothetical protein ACJ75Z_08125 [Solirubrobacterales bacterium]